jgi:CHAT domain-containing protein
VARFGASEREIDVDMLPDRFRQDMGRLQEAILQGSASRRVNEEESVQPPGFFRSLGPAFKLPDLANSIGPALNAMKSIGPALNAMKSIGPALDAMKSIGPALKLTSAVKAVTPGLAVGALRDGSTAFISGSDEKIIQEIGSQLFSFIFQRGVLGLYDECYKAAKDSDTPLCIKLQVNHPGLSYVPWETLYDATNRFYISTNHFTPFARSVRDQEDNKALAAGRPIRILGMAVRVKTLNGLPIDEIDVDGEQVQIRRALGDVNDEKRVKLTWIPSARPRDLNRGLMRGDEGKRWDIFHFIGHGGYDEERGMGFIVVQEEGGSKGARLFTDNLKAFLIQPGRTPKLVVLNSCSGARAQPGDLFSSTAVELIRGGIPAVVAMQFEISDEMGVAFSESFYANLGAGLPIHRALVSTRAELRAGGYSEWIAPVLYMRTTDGELFKEMDDPAEIADVPRAQA